MTVLSENGSDIQKKTREIIIKTGIKVQAKAW